MSEIEIITDGGRRRRWSATDKLRIVEETLDAHDREIISWRAVANIGISGSDVRDRLLEAVERRFASHQAPESVEGLSDNGSAYPAGGTRIFAQQLNLKPCFTPVKSPQANGMSEAFVKTLKRDYVRVNPLPDAQTGLSLIGAWIEDYNENHPHSGLKWTSPREFIRAKTETASVPAETVVSSFLKGPAIDVIAVHQFGRAQRSTLSPFGMGSPLMRR